MIIVASLPQTVPLHADLPAATAALAQIAARRPQLDQSFSINKAVLDCIYLLTPPRTIKQPISSNRRHSDRAAPRPKSP
jgi:hypothetical protein